MMQALIVDFMVLAYILPMFSEARNHDILRF